METNEFLDKSTQLKLLMCLTTLFVIGFLALTWRVTFAPDQSHEPATYVTGYHLFQDE